MWIPVRGARSLLRDLGSLYDNVKCRRRTGSKCLYKREAGGVPGKCNSDGSGTDRHSAARVHTKWHENAWWHIFLRPLARPTWRWVRCRCRSSFGRRTDQHRTDQHWHDQHWHDQPHPGGLRRAAQRHRITGMHDGRADRRQGRHQHQPPVKSRAQARGRLPDQRTQSWWRSHYRGLTA